MKYFVSLNATFETDEFEVGKDLLDKLQDLVSEMVKSNISISYKFDEHIPYEERKMSRHSEFNVPQK